MIAILDYGVGNLFSLRSSFAAIGAEATVTADPAVICAADKLVLPGVGAFEDAARKLRESGLDRLLKKEVARGKPLMGICLGMQLLFERSYEYGEHEGLELLEGSVLPFSAHIADSYKIPHIGWNRLSLCTDSPLWKYVKQGDYVYFVHSFFVPVSEKYTAATAEYGISFTAAVAKNNIYGCQFHPEKSGNVGLGILRGFCEAEGL